MSRDNTGLVRRMCQMLHYVFKLPIQEVQEPTLEEEDERKDGKQGTGSVSSTLNLSVETCRLLLAEEPSHTSHDSCAISDYHLLLLFNLFGISRHPKNSPNESHQSERCQVPSADTEIEEIKQMTHESELPSMTPRISEPTLAWFLAKCSSELLICPSLLTVEQLTAVWYTLTALTYFDEVTFMQRQPTASSFLTTQQHFSDSSAALEFCATTSSRTPTAGLTLTSSACNFWIGLCVVANNVSLMNARSAAMDGMSGTGMSAPPPVALFASDTSLSTADFGTQTAMLTYVSFFFGTIQHSAFFLSDLVEAATEWQRRLQSHLNDNGSADDGADARAQVAHGSAADARLGIAESSSRVSSSSMQWMASPLTSRRRRNSSASGNLLVVESDATAVGSSKKQADSRTTTKKVVVKKKRRKKGSVWKSRKKGKRTHKRRSKRKRSSKRPKVIRIKTPFGVTTAVRMSRGFVSEIMRGRALAVLPSMRLSMAKSSLSSRLRSAMESTKPKRKKSKKQKTKTESSTTTRTKYGPKMANATSDERSFDGDTSVTEMTCFYYSAAEGGWRVARAIDFDDIELQFTLQLKPTMQLDAAVIAKVPFASNKLSPIKYTVHLLPTDARSTEGTVASTSNSSGITKGSVKTGKGKSCEAPVCGRPQLSLLKAVSMQWMLSEHELVASDLRKPLTDVSNVKRQSTKDATMDMSGTSQLPPLIPGHLVTMAAAIGSSVQKAVGWNELPETDYFYWMNVPKTEKETTEEPSSTTALTVDTTSVSVIEAVEVVKKKKKKKDCTTPVSTGISFERSTPMTNTGTKRRGAKGGRKWKRPPKLMSVAKGNSKASQIVVGPLDLRSLAIAVTAGFVQLDTRVFHPLFGGDVNGDAKPLWQVTDLAKFMQRVMLSVALERQRRGQLATEHASKFHSFSLE